MLLLSFLGVWSVLAEGAEPGSRPCGGVGECHVDAEHTGLVQKTAHPVSYNKLEEADTDAETDSEDVAFTEVEDPTALQEGEVKSEAKRAAADLAGWQQSVWKPMMKFAEGEEMKKLEQEAFSRTSRFTLPMRSGSPLPGQTLDVNIANIQSDLRKAMQGFKAVPASEDSWNLAVEALSGTANITLPRGTYLRMAENLAVAQHKVQQDTALQDMIVGLVPAMAQLAANQELFEPMEAVNELAQKGKYFPEEGKPGGRDVASRLPDMARQNLHALKFLKPVLEHSLNGTAWEDPEPNEECDEKAKREAALENYDEKAPCASDALCFDPQLELGHFFNWAWSASNFKKVKKKPAGMDIQLNIGLVASLSGKSYRKLAALRAATNNPGPALPMFSSLAVSLKWVGHYTNGKMMALTTEMGFLYPKLSESWKDDTSFGQNALRIFPTFADVTVMMDYAQGGPRSTEQVSGKQLSFNLFNYATWGSTLNSRILGDTTLSLFSAKLGNKKAKRIYGGVQPRFGVVLGDYSWSSGWPVQLASKWWWKSKWGLTPTRKWSGLQSGFTLPFANKCYTYTEAKAKAAREKRIKDLESAKDLSDAQVRDLKVQQAVQEQENKNKVQEIKGQKDTVEKDLEARNDELTQSQQENDNKQAEIDKLQKQVEQDALDKEKLEQELKEEKDALAKQLQEAQDQIKELEERKQAFEDASKPKDAKVEEKDVGQVVAGPNQGQEVIEDIEDDTEKKDPNKVPNDAGQSGSGQNQGVSSDIFKNAPVVIDDSFDNEEQDDESLDISPKRFRKND